MARSHLKQQVIVNVISSLAIAVCVMWVIRWAGLVLAPAALGVFLLGRRFADAASNLIQLGTPHTLRRYIPMTHSPSRQVLYIVTASVLTAVAALAFLAALSVNLDGWRRMTFEPGHGTTNLMLWVGVLAVAQAASNIALSILLAYRRVVAFNIATAANASLWPVLALSMANGIEATFRWLALATLAFSLAVTVASVVGVARRANGPVAWHEWRSLVGDFTHYGLPRTVSPFVEVAFFLLGPWLIRNSIEEAGYLIIALTLLRVGQTVIQPAGNVMAVAVAGLVGRDDREGLRRGLNLLTGTLVYASILLVAIALPWTALLVRVWLGPGRLSEAVTPWAEVMMVSVVPFAIFQGLKEMIEMMWTRPRNLFTLAASSATLTVLYLSFTRFMPSDKGILAAYAVALCVAAGLSVWWIREHLLAVSYFGLGRLLAAAVGLGLLSWGVAHSISGAHIVMAVGTALLCGGACAAAAAVVLAAVRPAPFVRDSLSFLLSGHAALRET